MRSLPVSQKKRQTTTIGAREISSKNVKPQSRSAVTKNVTKNITKHLPKKTASPYFKKYKRYTKQGIKSLLLSPVFHASFKVVTGILISTSLLYGSYLYISKTFANEVIISQSEIVARVAKLTPLPQELPYEIVRVQDEDSLRKQNPFYKDIHEGDYILMYKNVAVIYDLRNNVIVGVKRSGSE